MSSTATAYSGERHECTTIDMFKNGLEGFQQIVTPRENFLIFFINICFITRDQFFAPYGTLATL